VLGGVLPLGRWVRREGGGVTPTSYEIRVSGALPDDAVAEFGDGIVLTTDVTTVLSGDLEDQAALLGLLARLRALGLNVVEVRRMLRAAHSDAEPVSAPDDQA
jgi:hypothetical protein